MPKVIQYIVVITVFFLVVGFFLPDHGKKKADHSTNMVVPTSDTNLYPPGPIPYLAHLPDPVFHLTKVYALVNIDWVHPAKMELVEVPWL